MRLRRVSIDGYGRFNGHELEFEPGLQVIIGPNERGKSTLRAFIGDMLYGQRRALAQEDFDDTRDLRVPWQNPDRYGGRLIYTLDDGREIEVVRDFAPGRESVQVLDRSNGREITDEYERTRGGEPAFALAHLGLSKEVFLGTATISHLTLEEIADGEAMDRIRERLLALADSGCEAFSSQTALECLKARIDAIGRTGAFHRPLPRARQRLDEVNREYREVLKAREEIAAVEELRRAALEQCAGHREHREAIEEELRVLDAYERAKRLEEAESLLARIQTATQHCFTLASVREFPLGQMPEVQRAETRLATAQVQLKRTQEQLADAQRQFDTECRRLGGVGDGPSKEIDADQETRLGEVMAMIQNLRERLSEADDQALALQEKVDEAQTQANTFPDFGQFAPDPVAWLTQLNSSFDVAVRTRDEECTRRDQVRQEVAQRRERIAPYTALFSGCEDFPEKAREYELTKRLHEEQYGQTASYLSSLKSTAEEIGDKLPGFRLLSAGLGLFLVLLLGAFFYARHPAILLPSGFTLIGALYFLLNLGYARGRLAKVQRDIEDTQARLAQFEQARPGAQSPIALMLAREGCETVRELEARYDTFRNSAAELAARQGVLDALEARAAEAEERVVRLFDRLRGMFRQINEQVDREEDIRRAAGCAVSRYQEFREAKSRLTDCRTQLERLQGARRKLQGDLQKALEEEAELAQALRATMRENGFEEEAQHESVAAALRAYRHHHENSLELRTRLKMIHNTVNNLERQVRAEELEVEKCEQHVAHLLARAGVSSVAQWHSMAAQAREYQEVWNKRAALQDQLDTLLRGEEVEALRDAVDADGVLPPAPTRGREDLKAEAAAAAEQMETCLREEHRLHLQVAEKAAGLRSLNEIEEERALLDRQVDDLELEQQAATFAMAQIEDIARDKHARIAPALAEVAGGYLAEITAGAYTQVQLARDFAIQVGVPAACRVLERPEKSLSKGTIDQVYLALRLALVRGISRDGEQLPMLLDDPFANYDDARLDRTMRLLARIGDEHQVILFTCRDDVARAAESVDAPVMRL